MLTCKSLPRAECRTESVIETASSWFSPKFLSGKLSRQRTVASGKEMTRSLGAQGAFAHSQTLNGHDRALAWLKRAAECARDVGHLLVSRTGDASSIERARTASNCGLT